MDYRPSLPAHNDNVSHGHPLREFFLILCALLGIALLAFWCLGLLVDFAVDRMSAESEAAINRAAASRLEPTPSFAPEKEALLQQLVDELRPCADVSYPVTVQLMQSDAANAAVFPGGHVIVLSGLLDKVRSRNGLAFVMAHELAHLKHRDHLRGLGRGVVLVAISAALTGGDGGLTRLLAPLNQLGVAQYSQKREVLADVDALEGLRCLFGHAGGALEFFEAMEKEKDSSLPLSHYFSSHPQLRSRIEGLRREIARREMPVRPVQPLGDKD